MRQIDRFESPNPEDHPERDPMVFLRSVAVCILCEFILAAAIWIGVKVFG